MHQDVAAKPRGRGGDAGKESRVSADGDTILRPPRVEDGPAMWRLVNDSGVLDPNSLYLYLMMARYFPDTCIVAEEHGRLAGMITGYRVPAEPTTLFIWQVGVSADFRGRGIASRMLLALARRPEAPAIDTIETTITPSNEASQRLFRGVARRLDAPVRDMEGFRAELFGGSGHEPEVLYRIGPFGSCKQRGEE